MKITEAMRIKVRAGQIWRKKDSGVVVEIVASAGDNRYRYRAIGGTKARPHAVNAKELWMFWEKL